MSVDLCSIRISFCNGRCGGAYEIPHLLSRQNESLILHCLLGGKIAPAAGVELCRPAWMSDTIFVLGTSRSGTSITTQLLQMMGGVGEFSHSQRFSWYSQYESEPVVQLNSQYMRAHGRFWNSFGVHEQRPRGACYAPLPLNASVDLVTQAARVIRRLRAQHSPPAGPAPRSPLLLKDPRFAWTLNLWLDALERNFGLPPPTIVLVHRGPVETALSLNCHEKHGRPIQHWEGTLRLNLHAVSRYIYQLCRVGPAPLHPV